MTKPQDGYAAVDPASPHTPSTPPSERAPNKSSTSSFERILHGLFLLLVVFGLLGFLIWLDIRFVSEVVSRQSIGRFVSMSGPGGLAGDVVIETDQGSYVLHGTPAVAKGTRLLLEVRGSGDHYICDESRSLCIRTSSEKFKSTGVQQPTSTSTQGDTP